MSPRRRAIRRCRRAARRRRRAASSLSCRLSRSLHRVVVPLVAVIMPPVALLPHVVVVSLADAAHVLVMFWHDFGREGGGAIVIMFARGACR